MTYNTVVAIRASTTLRMRMVACAAQEGKPNPESWVETRAWLLASSPGWAGAWESAMVSGIDDPGERDDVITDGMILGAIQPMG